MEIELNGEIHSLVDTQTLADLIASLNLGQQSIAVAVNRNIVPRARWQAYRLQAADKVDVVRAIGGG